MPGPIRNAGQLPPGLHRIEKAFRRYLRTPDPFLRCLLAKTSAGQGKRLRARLTLLAAAAMGKSSRQVERLGLALELLHQATLVHDDVIDHSGRRRHCPTVNASFGNEAAVLVGDLILSLASNLTQEMPAPVRSLLSRVATTVCLGEIQELGFRRRLDMTPRRYQQVILKKTASLFSACCTGGSMLARGPAAQVRRLGRYGRSFGLAFQIQDDLLDLTASSRRLGKPAGKDLREGRMTLPLILGLRLCRGNERSRLRRYLRGGEYKPRQVRHLLEQCGALAKARAVARTFARRAQCELESLPDSAAKAQLLALAEFAVARDH